jgi:uncharacterized YigZ family protein
VPEFILSKQTTGDYKEKGSSFHAVSEPASSADHVKSILLTLKEQFPDASHICYAYRIKKDKSLDEFSSDAGEPKGSAGISILNVLKRNHIVNGVIFVIRYFGGTKLGVPGLLHAYGTAAEDAIKDTKSRLWLEKKRLLVTYPYKLEGVMKSILQKNQAVVIHQDFGENIAIQLEIDVESTDEFIESVKELSSGSAQIIIED